MLKTENDILFIAIAIYKVRKTFVNVDKVIGKAFLPVLTRYLGISKLSGNIRITDER